MVTDPTTGWTAEGAEIAISDPDLDELVVTPSKLAGLTVVSNELMADSDPSALDVVGAGLVRDLQTRLDAAYFGDTVTNGPSGVESLANVQVTTGAFDGSLDVFSEAAALAENVGVLAVNPVDGLPNMAFVGNPPMCWMCPRPRWRLILTRRCWVVTRQRRYPAACKAFRFTALDEVAVGERSTRDRRDGGDLWQFAGVT